MFVIHLLAINTVTALTLLRSMNGHLAHLPRLKPCPSLEPCWALKTQPRINPDQFSANLTQPFHLSVALVR